MADEDSEEEPAWYTKLYDSFKAFTDSNKTTQTGEKQ